MNTYKDFNLNASISPKHLFAFFIAIFAVQFFLPEIVHAAVTFGKIGENVAENAKGIAKGITWAGFSVGIGMGVWGCVDMYKAVKGQGQSTYAGGLTKLMIGALLLGVAEFLGSGSATLFGTDVATGLDTLGI